MREFTEWLVQGISVLYTTANECWG